MSLTIHLPCEVGGTVYMIKNVKSGRRIEKRVVSGKIDRFIIGDLGVPLADICTEDNEWYYACDYPQDYCLSLEEAQETVKLQQKEFPSGYGKESEHYGNKAKTLSTGMCKHNKQNRKGRSSCGNGYRTWENRDIFTA